MRIKYWNSIVRCAIVEYYATHKWYSIKNQYAQNHIGSDPQDILFKIPLRDDQGHRYIKYHINKIENLLYIDM